MTVPEILALQRARFTIERMGMLLQEVESLRSVAARELHNRPSPIKLRPRRQYRPPAGRRP